MSTSIMCLLKPAFLLRLYIFGFYPQKLPKGSSSHSSTEGRYRDTPVHISQKKEGCVILPAALLEVCKMINFWTFFLFFSLK